MAPTSRGDESPMQLFQEPLGTSWPPETPEDRTQPALPDLFDYRGMGGEVSPFSEKGEVGRREDFVTPFDGLLGSDPAELLGLTRGDVAGDLSPLAHVSGPRCVGGVAAGTTGAGGMDELTQESSLSTRRVQKRLGMEDLASSLGGCGRGSRASTPGGGRKGRGGGGYGRPAFALIADTRRGGPRWCKPLFRAKPGVPGGLLRLSDQTGDAKDKNKIICRLCENAISFAASSYTTAEKHVGTHGITRDNFEVALSMANAAGQQRFPMQEWRDRLAAGAGDRKVSQYMQQVPYATGSPLWRDMRTAVAQWIAADSMPLSVVESTAFRRLCQALNGRCPTFSRKTISNKVRTLPSANVCCHVLLPCSLLPWFWHHCLLPRSVVMLFDAMFFCCHGLL